MRVPQLQSHKIRHLIQRHGVEYGFIRSKKDGFDQPVLDDNGNPIADEPLSVMGIFHESGSNFSLMTSEAAQVQSKPVPAVLAMWEQGKEVAVNDRLTVPPDCGIWYKVTAVNDIGNVQLFADISLEVIADGLQF